MGTKRNTLSAEIRQDKPFANPSAEAFLNLMRTSERLVGEMGMFLRGYGLTISQYNVLRILRGAGPEGLCSRDIADRMVTRDSDLTRLVNGLEAKELVQRNRSEADRRVVNAVITPAGRDLLGRITRPLNRLHEEQLGHLGPDGLRRLSGLLEEARRRGGEEGA